MGSLSFLWGKDKNKNIPRYRSCPIPAVLCKMQERVPGRKSSFLHILKQQDGEVSAFSEKLWCGLLDYATAYADGRLTFTFKNGSTFEG